MENSEKKTFNTDEWFDTWMNIRSSLNGQYELNANTLDNWNEAVEIFSERLQKFYITPINELKIKYEGQGFVIVTAQCALIETFAAFKEGKIYSDRDEDEIYYKKSRKLFVDFLESETFFQGNFGSGNRPRAKTFYSDVRCGLLHETKTRLDWIIKADVGEYVKGFPQRKDITRETFIIQLSGKNVIFRNQLQKALEDYFDQYKKDLKKSGVEYEKLRRLFARKLDHLFDIAKKDRDDFEWWEYSNNTKTINLSNKILQIFKSCIKFIYDRISAFF